jgi:hypothetical protein
LSFQQSIKETAECTLWVAKRVVLGVSPNTINGNFEVMEPFLGSLGVLQQLRTWLDQPPYTPGLGQAKAILIIVRNDGGFHAMHYFSTHRGFGNYP